MNHENIHLLEFSILWITGFLVLAIGIFFFSIYTWKIYQYRSKKGHKLDFFRNQYINGEITKDELFKLIKEL